MIGDLGDAGVYFKDAGTSGNQVLGNFIGVGPDGVGSQASNMGIFLDVTADSNTIGGSAPGAGNVISGNLGAGIDVKSNGNSIRGNFIGTDAAGESRLQNGSNGVTIEERAANNAVGGSGAGDGNLISGNGSVGVDIASTIGAPTAPVEWYQGEGDTSEFWGGTAGVAQNVGYAAGSVGQGFVFDGSDSTAPRARPRRTSGRPTSRSRSRSSRPPRATCR